MVPTPARAEFLGGPVLALDTGSPQVSVAVAADGLLAASRSLPQSSSSRELLPAIDQALRRSGLTLGDLGGLIALAGPGSFTGLRVGLATALGLHQATGIAATTLPTLEVLAAASEEVGIRVAAVDARRGEWVLQAFAGSPPEALGGSFRCSAEEIPQRVRGLQEGASGAAATVLGFGVSALAGEAAAWRGIAVREPPPLAGVAAQEPFRRELSWDPEALTRPLYFRPPAVTVASR